MRIFHLIISICVCILTLGVPFMKYSEARRPPHPAEPMIDLIFLDESGKKIKLKRYKKRPDSIPDSNISGYFDFNEHSKLGQISLDHYHPSASDNVLNWWSPTDQNIWDRIEELFDSGDFSCPFDQK